MIDCAGFQTWMLLDSTVEASHLPLSQNTSRSVPHRRGRPASWILTINFLNNFGGASPSCSLSFLI